MEWYLSVLRKYATFEGRARRKEYWMFTLFNVLIIMGLSLVDYMIGTFDAEADIGLLGGIYSLGVLIPSLAVGVRRLHDTDRSGWWLLLTFLPFLGAIILLIFFVLDGTPGQNRFGENPKQLNERT